MQEILNTPAPYGMIKDAEELIRTVDEVNTVLVSAKRAEAVAEIDKLVDQVKQELDRAAADTKLRSECLNPFDRLFR